ncbi:MAG: diphthine--ammonia ligase [Candidatus Micrarchaeaceae archaeon]
MIACLFSGGKDSMLALYKSMQQGIKPDLLITMQSKNEFSYMFHRPDVEFTKLQAEAMHIKQVFAYTEGIKEKELDDIERVLAENKVSALITGAIASMYQKSRIEGICSKLAIRHIAPLWHMPQEAVLEEVAKAFKAIIIQVSAEGLDKSYLGKAIDGNMVERLKALSAKNGINLAFEGGEAESFVLEAPMFDRRIAIKKAHEEWKGSVGRYIIDEAKLEPI